VDLLAVWAFSPTDVWAAGERILLHWDGTAWSTSDAGGRWLTSLWGTSSGELWAAGEGIVRWDGHGWTSVLDDGALYRGVWGLAGDDVFAISDVASVAHWDGQGWSRSVIADQWLARLSGTPDGGVWAGGAFMTILHLAR
jgi:hypothetical protein